MKKSILQYFVISACFIIPLIFYVYTFPTSIDFIDAAEFALVTYLGSVAHPPGTPSYVLWGWLWTKLVSLFSNDYVFIITLFSAVCAALTGVVIYLTTEFILKNSTFQSLDDFKITFISALTSLGMSLGMTYWNWANTVEVYTFQILCGAIMMHGLISYQIRQKYMDLVIASIGYAMGLANHHLTFIAFTPFILFFFTQNLFFKHSKKNQIPGKHNNLFRVLVQILTSRHFLFMTIITTVLFVGFYGWMMYRATFDHLYTFGAPDTLDKLWYHITGAVYKKNFVGEENAQSVFWRKVPYFSFVIFKQYFMLFPFVILGIIFLIIKKNFKFLTLVFLYFFSNIFYQLQRPSTGGDLEGHIIMPMLILGYVIPFGLYWVVCKFRYYYLLALLLLFQTAFTFGDVDKRQYNVSESLMESIDKSSPPNSVILISDWTLVMQYFYYRIVYNFRTDLVVLNYDIKFTHYRILPLVYPEFYKKVKKEYNNYVNELWKEHPQEVFNTGCTLSTILLQDAFKNAITKFKEVAAEQGGAFMLDPKAFYSLGDGNLLGLNSKIYPSGCFVSNVETNIGKDFLDLKFEWLNSPQLFNDPAAPDKLVDFEAMLDIHKDYYKNSGDVENVKKALQANKRIKHLQKLMKKSMPHIFKDKFVPNMAGELKQMIRVVPQPNIIP